MQDPVQPVTVNSRSYDGTIRRSWMAELIGIRPTMINLVGVFDREVEHEHLGTLRKGTISYEFFPLNVWYNIFRFHEPDGEFRNFYCNISMPPTFANGVLDYVDLDIDVLVWPDNSRQVLDMDEFHANSRVYGYFDDVIRRAQDALVELEELIEEREFPFDSVGTI